MLTKSSSENVLFARLLLDAVALDEVAFFEELDSFLEELDCFFEELELFTEELDVDRLELESWSSSKRTISVEFSPHPQNADIAIQRVTKKGMFRFCIISSLIIHSFIFNIAFFDLKTLHGCF